MNGGRVPAVILAGGLSRRMGEMKVTLPFGPARLIDHVAARLARQAGPLALNVNGALAGLDLLPRVPDDIRGFAGPLAGVAAAMAHVRRTLPGESHVLTVAADTPFFPGDLAERLAGAIDGPRGLAVAADADQNWHPVFALWPLALEPALRTFLSDPQNRRVRVFLEANGAVPIAFPLIAARDGGIDPFFNINTPEDYRRALTLLDDLA